MTYFEGFIVPVPEGEQRCLHEACDRIRVALRESASRRQVEAGTTTFPKARSPISARRSMQSPTRRSSSPGSNIREEARDAANEKFMSDPRMAEMGKDMPFDGKRMIIGGFERGLEHRAG